MLVLVVLGGVIQDGSLCNNCVTVVSCAQTLGNTFVDCQNGEMVKKDTQRRAATTGNNEQQRCATRFSVPQL